jgi:Arc/MetJ-type ribon-helix-helix transcriptional regulator
MTGDDNESVTFSMGSGLVEDIESQLDYGDTRSEWIRQAVRERLRREVWDDGGREEIEA